MYNCFFINLVHIMFTNKKFQKNMWKEIVEFKIFLRFSQRKHQPLTSMNIIKSNWRNRSTCSRDLRSATYQTIHFFILDIHSYFDSMTDWLYFSDHIMSIIKKIFSIIIINSTRMILLMSFMFLYNDDSSCFIPMLLNAYVHTVKKVPGIRSGGAMRQVKKIS